MRHSDIDARLAELYAKVPPIPDCDGRCWVSCGPTDRSTREDQRIRQRGFRISPVEDALAGPVPYYCEALTKDRRCAVYDIRPMVCRLWGAVEDMPCPFGCVPEGGHLSMQEGMELMAASMSVSGDRPPVPPGQIAAALASEHIRRKIHAMRSAGQQGVLKRIDLQVPPAYRKE